MTGVERSGEAEMEGKGRAAQNMPDEETPRQSTVWSLVSLDPPGSGYNISALGSLAGAVDVNHSESSEVLSAAMAGWVDLPEM